MSSRPTAIEALAEDPAASGVVLDFDGVLSPIVEDPTTSAMPDHVTAVLNRLAGRLGLLAVMSGRPAKFLMDRVRVEGIPLFGSYGIEQVQGGELQIDKEAEGWLTPVREAGDALTELLASSPGVRVERKSVSVAVHWRQAPDQEAAAIEVRQATAMVAASKGLALEPGKLVEELRPPIEINKGTAIRGLLAGRGLQTIAYAGDDLGDLPALDVVRDELHGYALVVDHGTETDQKLLNAASQVFTGTEGFADWLADLATAIGA
jgi:trehalose 6-phosphate phosphatase